MKYFDKLYASILDNISYGLADRYKNEPLKNREALLFEAASAVDNASIYHKLILWLFEPYKGHAVSEIYFSCLYVFWVEVDFNDKN